MAPPPSSHAADAPIPSQPSDAPIRRAQPPPRSAKSTLDPILKNCLRYTVSAKEYGYLHKYLIERGSVCPNYVKRRAPSPKEYLNILAGSKNLTTDEKGDVVPDPKRTAVDYDYNAAAVRAAIRLFLASQAGLKLWDLFTIVVLRRKTSAKGTSHNKKLAYLRSPNFRLSISLSSILLLHRLLYRFLTRLRSNLLNPEARPFRRRNPRVSRVLTSKLAPALGASLAGFALNLYPKDQLRVTMAIYVATRGLEVLYDKLEGDGVLWAWRRDGKRPGWFGSWILLPISCGQLLHAFLFDRDCFPKAYGDFTLKTSPNYIQPRPATYPAHLPWPGTYEIVDSLSSLASLSWPPFTSPILFPTTAASKPLLPPALLTTISPITSSAHPAIKSLSCALLHPHDPSCARTYLEFWIRAFPRMARFFALFYGVFALPRYKVLLHQPLAFLSHYLANVLRLSTVITGAIGSSWASICFFQNFLPRSFLPKFRFFLGGFAGGLFGFLDRKKGRGNFTYSARASIDSFWKVGVKRGWWRGMRGGDVWLFVLGLAIVNGVFETEAGMVNSGVGRRVLGGLRGEGMGDPVKVAAAAEKTKGEEAEEGKEM